MTNRVSKSPLEEEEGEKGGKEGKERDKIVDFVQTEGGRRKKELLCHLGSCEEKRKKFLSAERKKKCCLL